MFIPIQSQSDLTITILVEGTEVHVPKGISVAAAVLGHTENKDCRDSFISGAKRAPYCFIGVCHECLMEINGKPNQQACLTQVEDGMSIKKQQISEKDK